MALILVADDEPNQLMELRAALEAGGHEVALAPDGRLAMTRAGERNPDLLVVDLLMPVLDGWGVLKELGEQAAKTPVIILLAGAGLGSSAERRAMDAGATACLAKPVQPDEVVALVDHVLSSG